MASFIGACTHWSQMTAMCQKIHGLLIGYRPHPGNHIPNSPWHCSPECPFQYSAAAACAGAVTAVLASTVLAMQAYARTSGASGKGANLELAQSQSALSGMMRARYLMCVLIVARSGRYCRVLLSST